jgi:lipopolysaccharide/colanic/teichoic acid biosynthesis glycosyltransferase
MRCYVLSNISLKVPIMTKKEYDLITEMLKKRIGTIILKRLFDILVSLIMIVIFSPFLLILSSLIIVTSGCPIFFTQERMGKCGKSFKIYKFRTMRNNTATEDGMTMTNDIRITKLGLFLRKYRFDEIPQLFNIIKGEMSFVGPRPDLPKYYLVDDYGYKCVLLVKPGVTGEATLEFKDEDTILALSENPEKTYVEEIFPQKIRLNIEYIKCFSVLKDMKSMLDTFLNVFIKSGRDNDRNISIGG